jgi:nucleotide-binding universal stress UspA family protein
VVGTGPGFAISRRTRGLLGGPVEAGPAGTSILVAVSGGASGWRALDWAAAECASRRAELRILHVVERPVMGEPGFDTAPPRPDPCALRDGIAVLREAVRRARRVAPSADISTHLEFGNVVAAVCSASRFDAAVVIGIGRPGLSGPLSRGWRIVRRSSVPIVVVELDDAATPSSSAGRVVVGVEAGVASSTAVAHACEAASRRGSGVTIIAEFGAGEPSGRHGRRGRLPQALFEEATMHRCLDRYSDVDVRWRFPLDAAQPALLRESAGAALLVVGRPARARWDDLAGRTLSYAAFREARCPLALVPTP